MFCSACGAPRLSAFCTACGAAAGTGARYCATCGAPAGEAAASCRICGTASPFPSATLMTPAIQPAGPAARRGAGAAGMPPFIGVGRRTLATLIDLAPGGLLYILLAALFGDLEAGEDAAALSVTDPALALWVGAWFTYYLVMEARWGGTLGKLATGISIVRRDGGPAGWREALLRTLLRPVDAFGFYLLAAVLVWSSPARQRLGDRMAGTVIVPRTREQGLEVQG